MCRVQQNFVFYLGNLITHGLGRGTHVRGATITVTSQIRLFPEPLGAYAILVIPRLGTSMRGFYICKYERAHVGSILGWRLAGGICVTTPGRLSCPPSSKPRFGLACANSRGKFSLIRGVRISPTCFRPRASSSICHLFIRP